MDNKNNGDIREARLREASQNPTNNPQRRPTGTPPQQRVQQTPAQSRPIQNRPASPQNGTFARAPQNGGTSRQPQNPQMRVERANLGGTERPRVEGVPAGQSPRRVQRPIDDATRINSVTSSAPADTDATRVNDVVTPSGDTDATRKMDAAKKPETSEEKKAKKEKKHRDKSGYGEGGNTVVSLVKCMAYITVVLVVSIIISAAVILGANDIYGFVKSDKLVEITIPENATVEQVAEILHDNKIINYQWLFLAKEGDFSGEFVAGKHTLTPMTSYDDLLEALRVKPPSGISWVTIPEGFTTDEIIDLLVETGIGTREKYVEVINNHEFDYWFVDELGEDWDKDGRIYRLDGYLFPDTYQFYNASSEETVVNKLLKRFEQVFVESYAERAKELGFTVDEILILASLIEKEGGSAAEYGNISSVFHNRLKDPANYPYLESDATIAYAIQHETGVRPDLTGEDIDNNDSPYNSYKEKGLVPGPIANPSNSAILSALNPTTTNYHYFVSSDTETIFSETLDQHNAAINQILQQRENNASTNE